MEREGSREGGEAEAVQSAHHFNLGKSLWDRDGSIDSRRKGAEHFITSAGLDPKRGDSFRYLGYYYSELETDNRRAEKCFQRALSLNPDDSESGEALCDLLDGEGKEILQSAICVEFSEKSPKAFWAFRRLGYLQIYGKKYSQAVHSLQRAIRGYPACADLWEALGLAYQRLSMFTASLKAYGLAIELDNSKVLPMVESGRILLLLGSHKQAIEQCRQALKVSPESVNAKYVLASSLLGFSKECVSQGAFRWGETLLEEALLIAKSTARLHGNMSCIWKLCGDIQVSFVRAVSWKLEESGSPISEITEKDFSVSISCWHRMRAQAAKLASGFYQRALHLVPWKANLYIDTAIALDLLYTLENGDRGTDERNSREKMCVGALLLEGDNSEFWVGLGCLSGQNALALKQHAFIRGLHLDASLACSWAYLGKLYRSQGEKQLAIEAFDRARSIDPSHALPWAGASADWVDNGDCISADDAYESCFTAIQTSPIPEFKIGFANLSLRSGRLSSPQVLGAVCQAVGHAPHHPEAHNLNGLVLESRSSYQSASVSYSLARFAMRNSRGSFPTSRCLRDVSVNLARSLCKSGNAIGAIRECDALNGQGVLDPHVLQIHALCLWTVGKKDSSLSVVKRLAANVSGMEREVRAASIIFICRVLYSTSGTGSAADAILKMPERFLVRDHLLCLVLASIDSLDRTNRLRSTVESCCPLDSGEKLPEMHYVLALVELANPPPSSSSSSSSSSYYSGVAKRLRKALHMFPHSDLVRNLLGYVLLISGRVHDAIRCCGGGGGGTGGGLYSARDVSFAGAIDCFACVYDSTRSLSFPTSCPGSSSTSGLGVQEVQRWSRDEPWNSRARYLLVLYLFQKARHERFPLHLREVIRRLIARFLPDSSGYERFLVLLCSSEIHLRNGDHAASVRDAEAACLLSVLRNHGFFAHLMMCRGYAAIGDVDNLRSECRVCVASGSRSFAGRVCLRMLVPRFVGADADDGSTAVFELASGLGHLHDRDFRRAENRLARACLLDPDNGCVMLCHGVACLELVRHMQGGSEFVTAAVRSLRRAASRGVPFARALLAVAEGSLGSRREWMQNVRAEWDSWPYRVTPPELYLQMNLADGEVSNRRIRQAIHMNPSVPRYWTALLHLNLLGS